MSKQHTLKDLELPDDEPMVIIRKSFLWICDGDKYAAAALNMYVHWTKWLMKRKPVAYEINKMLKKQGGKASQDTSLILYRKQKDLVTDLLNFCNEKRLRQANEFLESKGLLKIDSTPRSNLDHVLKYELQIDVFKGRMADWRKHREEEEESQEDEDETVEVSLEADLPVTDNSPSRNGQKSASEATNVGLGTDNSPSLNKNIDNSRDKPIDEGRKNGESTAQESSSTHSSIPSQSSSEVLFTEEESQVLSHAKKLRLSYLSKNEKNKAHCSKLVSEGVTTLEQLKSLMQFCKQRPYLKDRDLNLGNLASEIDGWLQLQKQSTSETPKTSFLASDATSDQNLEKIQARIAAKQKQKEKVTL